MKYRTRIILVTLLTLLAACRAGPVPTLPLPPTTTATLLPTATPTLTSTPIPTPTLTPTPLPAVWQILFTGFPCEGRTMCVPFDDTQNYYYSINSDGTGLEQLQVSSFPPVPSLPEGAPPLLPGSFNASPHLSPDGSLLAYFSDDRGLYIVDIESGKATLLFRPEGTSGTTFFVGPACWSPDGLTIRFVMKSRQGNERQPPAFYTIAVDGSDLRLLFTLPGLEDMAVGGCSDCSPDGRELAFSIPESPVEGKAGL